jgi:hypothetical protein
MPFDSREMSSLSGSPPKTRKSPGTMPEAKADGSARPGGNAGESLGEVFKLDHEERVLEKRIKIKKLKDQLKEKPKIREAGEKGDPVAVSSAGMDDHRFAVLSWPDGREIRISLLERLPDGSKVVRIDGSGVEVRTVGGGRVVYPYGRSFRDHGNAGGPANGYPANGFYPPPARVMGGGR